MDAGKMSEILKMIADNLEKAKALATPEVVDKFTLMAGDLGEQWKAKLADGTVDSVIEFCRRFADHKLILRVISMFGEAKTKGKMVAGVYRGKKK